VKILKSGGVLLALVLMSGVAPAAQPAGDLIVPTATGSVRGAVINVSADAAPGGTVDAGIDAGREVLAFKGIPYAAPRWALCAGSRLSQRFLGLACGTQRALVPTACKRPM